MVFIGEGMSYIVLRDGWCIINHLMCINQVKRNVMNQKRVQGELKHIEYHFPKYRIEILLVHFNVNLERE